MKKVLCCLILFSSPFCFATNNEKLFTKRFGHSSGMGSTLENTIEIRKHLPNLLEKLNCKTFLDLPCGDFKWMQTIELPIDLYIGADIISNWIESHQRNFETPKRVFVHLDACVGGIPQADVILCRDMLVHLPFNDIFQVLKNMKKSGSKYLLMTHFHKPRVNTDIIAGGWRTINFTLPPFNFPPPIYMLDEKYTKQIRLYEDKVLALWEIDSLPLEN